MVYNFFLSVKAEKDIQSAFQWYEQQRLGLGLNFFEAIDNAFKSIKINPLVYGFRKKI